MQQSLCGTAVAHCRPQISRCTHPLGTRNPLGFGWFLLELVHCWGKHTGGDEKDVCSSQMCSTVFCEKPTRTSLLCLNWWRWNWDSHSQNRKHLSLLVDWAHFLIRKWKRRKSAWAVSTDKWLDRGKERGVGFPQTAAFNPSLQKPGWLWKPRLLSAAGKHLFLRVWQHPTFRSDWTKDSNSKPNSLWAPATSSSSRRKQNFPLWTFVFCQAIRSPARKIWLSSIHLKKKKNVGRDPSPPWHKRCIMEWEVGEAFFLAECFCR